MLPERKSEMIATRRRIQKEYSSLVKEIGLHPTLDKDLFSLIKKRVNSLGVRSFFVSTLYQYICEKAADEKIKIANLPEDIFASKLPFIAEAIISIQYYENQILDGKGGLFENGDYDMNKVHKNLLSSHYIKDCVYNYIDKKMHYKDHIRNYQVIKAVRKIFQYVDLGQTFQDEWGTFEFYSYEPGEVVSISCEVDLFFDMKLIEDLLNEIKKVGPIDEKKEAFTLNYLRRIYLPSGALFKILAKLIMDLLGYHGEERSDILKNSAVIGMIGQMVNDINDFVPAYCGLSTASKIPADAFSDIRNNNVTLPLIFFFADHPCLNMNDLDSLRKTNPNELLNVMMGTIEQTKEATASIANYSEQEQFIDTKKQSGKLLMDLNSIVKEENNRFYQAIRETSQSARITKPAMT